MAIITLRGMAQPLGARPVHATAAFRATGSVQRPTTTSFNVSRGLVSTSNNISVQTGVPAKPILGACRASAGSGNLTEGFFPREHEISYLEGMLAENPSKILVLSGPEDSGKTALLTEVRTRRAAAHASESVRHPSVFYMEMRWAGADCPGGLACALSNIVTRDAAWWEEFKPAFEVRAAAARDATSLSPQPQPVSSLESLLGVYQTALQGLDPGPRKPVIIINAAHELMEWQEEDPSLPQLRCFINFLITLTKQELAHVVLETYDFSLASWLGKVGLERNHYIEEVVGHLLEDDAKRFLCGGGGGDWPGLISEFSRAPPVDDDTWAKVYAQCGGNFGFLRRCCKASALQGSWENGLRSVLQAPAEAVGCGLNPEIMHATPTMWMRASPPAWTAEQYKAVLRAIVGAKHHAVLLSALSESVSNAALQSMEEYKLIARRPYSPLARDLPLEVFGGDTTEVVVTMRSPGALYCAVEMKADGELAQ